MKFLEISHLKIDFRHWFQWAVVNEILAYLTEYQSEWIPLRSETALINEFMVYQSDILERR